MDKNLFQTKTFWANLLGPLFLYVSTKYGIEIDEGTQTLVIMGVMAIVNIVIRRFTKVPVTILPKGA